MFETRCSRYTWPSWWQSIEQVSCLAETHRHIHLFTIKMYKWHIYCKQFSKEPKLLKIKWIHHNDKSIMKIKIYMQSINMPLDWLTSKFNKRHSAQSKWGDKCNGSLMNHIELTSICLWVTLIFWGLLNKAEAEELTEQLKDLILIRLIKSKEDN